MCKRFLSIKGQKRIAYPPKIACHLAKVYHFGVMPMKIPKLMPGIGRDKTERYSSLKRLFIVPLSERSAHLKWRLFSMAMLLIKYGGSFPVSDRSFDDIVNRSE